MRLSLIVAVSQNRVIGRAGQLPWRLSADLQRFKQITMGHHLLMGRKTFESIGRLLPGRQTVIITRQPDYTVAGAQVVHDLPAALRAAAGDREAFVIGGAEIYRLALPQADRIYLTRVQAEVEGDVCLPEIDDSQWKTVSCEDYPADERNEYPHQFCVLERR